MKKKIILPLVLSALLITACGENKSNAEISGNPAISGEVSSNEGGDSGASSASNSSSSYVEDYPITVTQTQGVTITVAKKRAVKGEKIEFTVTANAGYRVTDVKTNSAAVTNEGNGKYSFIMPERSVRITVSVEIDGDFVLTGDFSAKLEKEGDLYVARNVSVPYSGNDYAEFTYVVQQSGQSTRLNSLALDETRCFANVSFTTSNANSLRIATGCTYDFYYDVNSGERPCYVIRKSVDQIPTTGEALFTRVFDGRMRSEPTLHALDLKGIDYTFDTTELKYAYSFKKYAQDASLATITDTSDVNNTETYYVYKHADYEHNVYEVVNTWTKEKGNNENEYALWELDPYGDSMGDGKTHQAFSARLDITPEETDTRLEISERDVKRNIGMGAHYGAELEYEFYDAYRSVFSGNVYINAPSWVDPGYTVEANSDGSFKVTVNSTVEYNRDATSGTADVTDHSGHTNALVMNFLKNGALKDMTWTRSDYEQSQWNFTTHKPNNANNGTIKRVTCTNTYGDAYAGAPSFDASKYFISSISKASWYNKDNTEGKSSTVSNVCFGDTLEFYPYGEAGKKSSIVDEFVYTPSTALDMWQYGVVSVGDKNIVDLNGQNRYEVINVGATTVTVGNRTANSGASIRKDINIKSQATPCALNFYVDFRVAGYDSYGCDDSTTLIARAGKSSTYYIDVSATTGKKAPVSFSFVFVTGKDRFGNPIYSDTCEYLTYTLSGHCLTLNCDTEASRALTETKEISAIVDSDYYQPGRTPTTFTIRILPAVGGDIVGSNWIYNTYVDETTGEPLDSQTDIHFYNKKATGYGDNVYEGKIVDYYAKGNDEYTDEFKFVYQVNNMGLIVAAQVTEVTIETPELRNARANNFYLIFANPTDDGLLPTVLWYETSEDIAYILGKAQWDEENQVVMIDSYQGFTRV